jgi:hypothetical protein
MAERRKIRHRRLKTPRKHEGEAPIGDRFGDLSGDSPVLYPDKSASFQQLEDTAGGTEVRRPGSQVGRRRLADYQPGRDEPRHGSLATLDALHQ